MPLTYSEAVKREVLGVEQLEVKMSSRNVDFQEVGTKTFIFVGKFDFDPVECSEHITEFQQYYLQDVVTSFNLLGFDYKDMSDTG